MRKVNLLVVLALILLAACTGGALNVTGNWAGSFTGNGASLPFTMTLT